MIFPIVFELESQIAPNGAGLDRCYVNLLRRLSTRKES